MLQWRWAHFSAVILEHELIHFRKEVLATIPEWAEYRRASRIRKICTDLTLLEVDFGEYCPICYNPLFSNETREERISMKPVKLPCGHKFCRGCVEEALKRPVEGEYALTCPACRRGFGLFGMLVSDTLSADMEMVFEG